MLAGKGVSAQSPGTTSEHTRRQERSTGRQPTTGSGWQEGGRGWTTPPARREAGASAGLPPAASGHSEHPRAPGYRAGQRACPHASTQGTRVCGQQRECPCGLRLPKKPRKGHSACLSLSCLPVICVRLKPCLCLSPSVSQPWCLSVCLPPGSLAHMRPRHAWACGATPLPTA